MEVLQKNLVRSHFEDISQVVRGRLLETGEWLRRWGPFDLILADPPYEETAFHPLLEWLAHHRLLVSGGCLVYQQEALRSSAPAPEIQPLWRLWKERRYGRTQLLLLYYEPQREKKEVREALEDCHLPGEF